MNQDNLDPANQPVPAVLGSVLEFEPDAAVNHAPHSAAPLKVVIEYRTRGLPWPVVLPLLVLVSLAAVATYHRTVKRPIIQLPIASPANPGAAQTVQADPRPAIEPVPLPSLPEPLTLSSQRVDTASAPPRPIGPAEFIGPPFLKVEELNGDLANTAPRPESLSQVLKPPVFELPTSTLPAALFVATPTTPKRLPELPRTVESPISGVEQSEETADPKSAPATSQQVIPPLPEKLPTRDEVLAEIQREADQKRADRKELKQFKDESPELLRRAYLAEVNGQRSRFLAELRDLLHDKKNQAGVDISQLHTRYVHEVDAETRKEMMWLMKRSSGKLTLQAKIKALRSLGLPEPAVLDVICNEIHHRSHSTKCRCFKPQMYVLAARELLATELPGKSKPRNERGSAGKPATVPAKPASTENRASARSQ